MATYTFTINDFSLTTTWKRMTQSSGVIKYDIIDASVTKNFAISGIALAENESINRVMLTASISRSGTTDYSETITVNNLGFASGSRRIDASEISNGTTWDATFYVRATGDAGKAGALNETVSYSCTVYFSNIVLTVTTGTNGSFDGTVGSLAEGTKFLLDEPSGTTGVYTLVQHNYNDGKCLLWRDDIYTNKMFNSSKTAFTSGELDTYLNSEFYDSLPDSTKQYIVSANYPTLSNHTAYGGSVVDLTRYVCTPSLRELFDGVGDAEGMVFEYLATRVPASATAYWTRSMLDDTSARKARYINADGDDYFSRDVATACGVRPCFAVLEEQIVVPSGDFYKFAAKYSAPGSIYLNSSTANLSDKQIGFSATLSWDAVSDANIRGYAVWRCTDPYGTYEYIGEVNAGDDGSIPTSMIVNGPDDGFITYYYKVQTLGASESDYCDSDLSETYRFIATKRTKIKYYDGYRWLLAAPKHYANGAWTIANSTKYYNGSRWIVLGEGTDISDVTTTAALGDAKLGYMVLGGSE